MPTYILILPGAEVVRLLRAETVAAFGQPEINMSAWKEYLIEEKFEPGTPGIHERGDYDLVTAVAVLNIEPRVERNYWVLKVIIERPLGSLGPQDEAQLARMEMTLDEFEADMRSAGRKRITVRLVVETSDARQHFDLWLTDLRSRHPREARSSRSQRSKGSTATSRAAAPSRVRQGAPGHPDMIAKPRTMEECHGH